MRGKNSDLDFIFKIFAIFFHRGGPRKGGGGGGPFFQKKFVLGIRLFGLIMQGIFLSWGKFFFGKIPQTFCHITFSGET